MSKVAQRLAGRYYWRWEKEQDAECVSRSSGGRCSSRVTQWQCLNGCYQLREIQMVKLVNGNWTYCDKLAHPATPRPLPIFSLPKHNTMLTRRMGRRTDIVNVQMIMKDDAGCIPARYQQLVEVFINVKTEALLPQRPIDHAINLELDYNLPLGQIYNRSQFQLMILLTYIDMILTNGFIQRSMMSASALILFARMKDARLQLFVNYWALNLGMVKNKYPLSLKAELLYQVREAWIFTKLNLQNAYNLILRNTSARVMTASQTGDDLFKCRVMPSGLSNTQTSFQAYYHDLLWPYIDGFTMCYTDNILIYWTNEKAHEDHIWKVLQHLLQFELYCNARKCWFGVQEISFHAFFINSDAVGQESARIATFENWLTAELVWDVQALLRFMIIYQRFIDKHANMTTSISHLLTNRGSQKWEWT